MTISRLTRITLALSLLISLLGSCSTTKSFDLFPRKMIDRPYTLPSGIDAWRTIAPGSFGVDTNGNSQVSYPIPVPLFWQQSLADDWELQWAILPFAVSHQFVRDTNGYVGGQLGLVPAYDQYLGWGLTPVVYNENLFKLSPDAALLFGGSFGSTVYFSGGPILLNGDLSIAPIYQITSDVAVALRPNLKFAYNSDYSRVQGTGRISASEKLVFLLPIDATLRWSASRQWDINLDYTFNSIGLQKGSYSHDVALTLINFW